MFLGSVTSICQRNIQKPYIFQDSSTCMPGLQDSSRFVKIRRIRQIQQDSFRFVNIFKIAFVFVYCYGYIVVVIPLSMF